MTPPPFITLTGADEETDVLELRKLSREGAEIGFLYTTSPEGRNRYPRWQWIRDAVMEVPRASLHICGSGARAALLKGALQVGGFQRIQVNGYVPAAELAHLCAMYPNHTILTQHREENAGLLGSACVNHAVLIDSSGGRGISPDRWPELNTEKAVGFAGGLGANNLVTQLPEIVKVARAGWWVDMEAKLRDREDWFSLERARECFGIFDRAMLI